MDANHLQPNFDDLGLATARFSTVPIRTVIVLHPVDRRNPPSFFRFEQCPSNNIITSICSMESRHALAGGRQRVPRSARKVFFSRSRPAPAYPRWRRATCGKSVTACVLPGKRLANSIRDGRPSTVTARYCKCPCFDKTESRDDRIFSAHSLSFTLHLHSVLFVLSGFKFIFIIATPPIRQDGDAFLCNRLLSSLVSIIFFFFVCVCSEKERDRRNAEQHAQPQSSINTNCIVLTSCRLRAAIEIRICSRRSCSATM